MAEIIKSCSMVSITCMLSCLIVVSVFFLIDFASASAFDCAHGYECHKEVEDQFMSSNTKNLRRQFERPEPESEHTGFPQWMTADDQRLLKTRIKNIRGDIVVAQDGTGTVRTISEAINLAPDHSPRRVLILVKAGIYAEKDMINVGDSKTNLWMLGEGIDRTIITGNKSMGQGVRTFLTATFAVSGAGFVAKGISFVNEAGPENYQAVALRVDSDQSVFYQCAMKGYQDTLYVHSNKQFYRECDIYGTVDFIFGDASAVFQNCTMWARKPLTSQNITITAQGRVNSTNPTGISIQGCQIRATRELEVVKASFPTFLGRPWKTASRVVYMESYIGDHVHPRGWSEWERESPTSEIYYGEYKNFGPGANITQRVKWVGVHVNMTREEAQNFTVDSFIEGKSWLPSTGVPYQGVLLA